MVTNFKTIEIPKGPQGPVGEALDPVKQCWTELKKAFDPVSVDANPSFETILGFVFNARPASSNLTTALRSLQRAVNADSRHPARRELGEFVSPDSPALQLAELPEEQQEDEPVPDQNQD